MFLDQRTSLSLEIFLHHAGVDMASILILNDTKSSRVLSKKHHIMIVFIDPKIEKNHTSIVEESICYSAHPHFMIVFIPSWVQK